jgi:Glycosyltransferase Family 4
MKLLFVHQSLGALGGAEANIQITANELRGRGHTVALLHGPGTGRDEQAFRETFSETFCLSGADKIETATAVVDEFGPDVIYLHNLADLGVIEALLQAGAPVVRMVHDHAMYCMRGYKYNPFTRNICTRAASLYCIFPCGASISRNRQGSLPVTWVSYAAKRKEIRLLQRGVDPQWI